MKKQCISTVCMEYVRVISWNFRPVEVLYRIYIWVRWAVIIFIRAIKRNILKAHSRAYYSLWYILRLIYTITIYITSDIDRYFWYKWFKCGTILRDLVNIMVINTWCFHSITAADKRLIQNIYIMSTLNYFIIVLTQQQ